MSDCKSECASAGDWTIHECEILIRKPIWISCSKFLLGSLLIVLCPSPGDDHFWKKLPPSCHCQVIWPFLSISSSFGRNSWLSTRAMLEACEWDRVIRMDWFNL